MKYLFIARMSALVTIILIVGYSSPSIAEEKPLPETVPLENWEENQIVYPENPVTPAPTAVPIRKSWQERRMEQRALREQNRIERREEKLTSLVFGLSVAGSAICVIPALLASAVFDSMSDVSVEVSYGIALGLSPVVSTLMASTIANRSNVYDMPWGKMILSGYVPAVASYVALFFFMEKDDPKVDGEYDPIYFNKEKNNESIDGFLGFLTLGLVPLIIPATCITIGYHWGRKKKSKSDDYYDAIAFTPPMPVVMRGPETGQRSIGLRLVGGTF